LGSFKTVKELEKNSNIIYKMKLLRYVSAFIIVTAIGILYDRYKKKWGFLNIEQQNQKNIQKYLLNEKSIINGKPILWIHNKYEINSRNWTSFMSRNTNNLNQPYRRLCVDTIIKHCSDDFNICLIDDNSFSKLLSDWNIIIDDIAEPIKTRFRRLGLFKLLYNYGGVLIPSSTIALKSIKPCYDKLLSKKDCFVGEFVDKTNVSNTIKFFPNTTFMGCSKLSSSMKKLISYMEKNNDNTDSDKFDGTLNRYVFKMCENNEISLLDGKFIGTKCKDKPVLLENLMSSSFTKLNKDSVCIVLPEDDIKSRSKYQWFLRLSRNQLLETDTLISKYFMISLGK
tara:strand:+ start:409 stop:1428 length:1020 start_codon:yes stop_codon:yes gene_type:complete